MNNKEIVEKINWLETHFNVRDLNYGSVDFWPYIRQLISLRFVKNSTDDCDNRKSSILTFSSLFSFLRAIRSIYVSDRAHNLKKISESDVMIMIDASSRQERINGKYYCRTADAIIDFFETDFNLSTWEYSLKNNYPQPRYRPTEYIDIPLFVFMVFGAFIGLVGQLLNPKLVKPICALNKVMLANQFRGKLPPRATVCKIYSILLLAKYFEKRLSRIKPKVVFIPEFYNAISMALSLACYRCNIVSVEYQHGAQNDYHRMYTHWKTVPRNGYQLVPKYFWSWGEISAQRIGQWASRSNYHKVIVGGNLWMLKNISSMVNDSLINKELKTHYPKDKRHILITLQKWPDYFNFKLLSIIKRSPSNWYWHIRQHPLHKLPAQDIQIYFSDPKIQNVDIEFSTKASLYNILKRVDVHLTGFSTVAFEAQAFNVPTIFFHENAMLGFSDLIDNRDFYYADTEQEIMKHLRQLIEGEKHSLLTSGEYIVTSSQIAADALATVIGRC